MPELITTTLPTKEIAAALEAKEAMDWLRDNARTIWKNPHNQGGWAIEYADGHKMARGATLSLAIKEARKG